MTERQPSPAASATREAIHRRSLAAPKPRAGEPMSLAYRLRLFSLDRWNLWGRLTRYRSWEGPAGETPGRDQHRLRARHRLVGQGTLPEHARLQAPGVGAHRQSPHRRHRQCARWPWLSPRRGRRVTAGGKGAKRPRSPRPPTFAWCFPPSAQGGGRGQAVDLPGHPVAQAQTRTTADPLKLPTARLAHEGTSSDLGERPTHQAAGYVPSSLTPPGADLSERDQDGARDGLSALPTRSSCNPEAMPSGSLRVMPPASAARWRACNSRSLRHTGNAPLLDPRCCRG